MKKILLTTIAVVLIVCSLALCAYGCAGSKYNSLVKAIDQHGKASNDIVSVDLGNNVDIYYYKPTKNKWVTVSYISGSITFFVEIDSKLSGLYSWTLRYNSYKIGGRLRVYDGEYDLVEYISERSSGMSYQIATTMNNLAETACELCIINFTEFIERYTNLSLSDF